MECFGLYRGQVFSNKDPLGRRRLKVLVPAILGESPTGWAWPVDHSGSQQGTPAVGQGVWIMFENGDPGYPIWVGTFGDYKGPGTQVVVNELDAGSYPETVTRSLTNTEFDVVAAVADLAAKVEEIRLSLNAHGGGDTESPPSDVSP